MAVEQFADARRAVDVAVTGVLENEQRLRNLGQDSLDEIEQSLRQTRIDIDRGLLVFSKFRTIRARQSLGGAVGAVKHRVSALETAVSAATSGADTDSTETNNVDEEEPAEPALGKDKTVKTAEEVTS
jgi:hypothetical protein